jgi:hypothetical protein
MCSQVRRSHKELYAFYFVFLFTTSGRMDWVAEFDFLVSLPWQLKNTTWVCEGEHLHCRRSFLFLLRNWILGLRIMVGWRSMSDCDRGLGGPKSERGMHGTLYDWIGLVWSGLDGNTKKHSSVCMLKPELE